MGTKSAKEGEGGAADWVKQREIHHRQWRIGFIPTLSTKFRGKPSLSIRVHHTEANILIFLHKFF